ncbi:MAG TPA: Gfo/Idh/MocA family oxidoreductase [Pirellulales bacterium]|nr:Gfo/Idh/MocA family oxidoreductase [Pirellulales bacterium]
MNTPRLLIIGLGSIGERHLRCAQRLGRFAVTCFDINTTLRDAVAVRYGIAETYDSLEQAIAAAPAAAVICVPAHLHVAIATQLADRGIHLLIEKPLSTSQAGIGQLQSLVQQRRIVAGVGYVIRANPTLTAMREVILEGRFGRPVELVAMAGQDFPFYRPAYRDTYYRDRATGGGAIQDALTHLVNAGEWLVGPIDRVAADARHAVVPGVDVEDTVHVLARHGEITACYSLNQYQAPNEFTITVVCQRGTLRFELHENRWRWMVEPGNTWHDEAGAPIERDDLFATQLHTFCDAIERRSPLLCTLDEGAQTLRVNLAILKSLETAGWVSTAAS